MKKRILVLLPILLFIGCGSGKSFSLMENKLADEVKLADKVTGVESVKLADDLKAENEMQAGSGNKIEKNQKTSNTNVGGNMSNDPEVIKDMIEANKELSEKILDTHIESKKSSDKIYWSIIGALLLLIGDFRIQVAKNTGRLLKMIETDNESEERRMDKLLERRLKEVKNHV